VGSVFLKDRLLNVPLQANEVKAGDRLTPLKGWNWSAHDRTLVLALRKGCHFCEDSAPFYQRLVGKQADHGTNVAIVAIFPDLAAQLQQWLGTGKLHFWKQADGSARICLSSLLRCFGSREAGKMVLGQLYKSVKEAT
jgi:thiol-disulfide isomerase/thioredoxin